MATKPRTPATSVESEPAKEVQAPQEEKMVFGIYNVSKDRFQNEETFDTLDQGYKALGSLESATSNIPGEKLFIGEDGDLLTVRRKK